LTKKIENKDNFNELRINFAYNYSFDVLKKKDKKHPTGLESNKSKDL